MNFFIIPQMMHGDGLRILQSINESFFELRNLANSLISAPLRKTTLTEFLYKLKTLEKDLYFVSVKLKDLQHRNENLSTNLDFEKERSRKRVAKIQSLESQLASTDFKLKVRTNNMPNAKRYAPKDVGIQTSSLLEGHQSDIVLTMNNMRNTTMATLHVIKSLINGNQNGNGGNVNNNELMFEQDFVDKRAQGDRRSSTLPFMCASCIEGNQELLELVRDLQGENQRLKEIIQRQQHEPQVPTKETTLPKKAQVVAKMKPPTHTPSKVSTVTTNTANTTTATSHSCSGCSKCVNASTTSSSSVSLSTCSGSSNNFTSDSDANVKFLSQSKTSKRMRRDRRRIKNGTFQEKFKMWKYLPKECKEQVRQFQRVQLGLQQHNANLLKKIDDYLKR